MEEGLSREQIRQLEEEFRTDIVPGTEVMTDIGHLHFVHSGGETGEVLVPQPHNSPNDPLNWSPFWKFSVIAMCCLYTFIQPLSQLSIAPIFGTFAMKWELSIPAVANFIGVAILVLGFSNFLWVPIATMYGRRIVFIASAVVCIGGNIWHALAQSGHSYIGSCVIDGIAGGPGETLMPMVIADVLFLHERGRYMTLYMTTYFGSLMLSSIIAGAMTEHINYQSFFWLNVGLRGLIIILAIFFFPETKWQRDFRFDPENDPNLERKQETPPVERLDDGSLDKSGTSDIALTSISPHKEYRHVDEYLHKGKPSWKQFRLFQPRTSSDKWAFTLMRDFLTPLKLLVYPIVLFGGMAFNFSAAQFLYINLLQSQLFTAPPYNFSQQSTGFTNFALFVGAVFGLVTCGPLSDWIAARATKRNGGIREPEMRLPALIPYQIINIIGAVVWGVGANRGWDWKPIVIVGFSFIGCQVAAIPAICMTYAIDSYKPAAGQILVTATVFKNVWGYGVSRFVNDWVAKAGYVTPVMVHMVLSIVFSGIGAVILFFVGKPLRRWTRNDSVHRL